MLPDLPDTDILSHPPDGDRIDLWAEDFSWPDEMSNPGVYCFYDADTDEILYIGSASARSSDRSQSGIRMRLQFYKSTGVRSKTASVRKVNMERKNRKVLVRFWVSASAGDARKYEYDAIEKYRPILNSEMSAPVQSDVERKRKRCECSKRIHERYKREKNFPSSDSPKRCPSCKQMKTLDDFYRNSCRKDGRKSICKECSRLEQQRLRAKRKVRADPTSTSSKTKKAEKYGTEVISEERLMEMIG